MKDISLHLTNAIDAACSAGATFIKITDNYDTLTGFLTLRVSDNGEGFDFKTLEIGTYPIYINAQTNEMIFDFSLQKVNVELAGGRFDLESKLNEGTAVTMVFDTKSCDFKPLANLAECMQIAITTHPEVRFCLNLTVDGMEFNFDTSGLREYFGENVDFDNIEIYKIIFDYLLDNISALCDGRLV